VSLGAAEQLLIAAAFLLGAGFALVASIGLLRMPDLPTRLHATSKAGSLGTGLILFGVALFHHDLGVSARAVVTALFILLTGPVAAHIIARAAYFAAGMSLWEGTRLNELEGRYNRLLHEVESATPEERARRKAAELEEERQRAREAASRRRVRGGPSSGGS
jgi:multicomponent Na+:H+ antiporter subunit G